MISNPWPLILRFIQGLLAEWGAGLSLQFLGVNSYNDESKTTRALHKKLYHFYSRHIAIIGLIFVSDMLLILKFGEDAYFIMAQQSHAYSS
jgi:hypothetical protein